jgi:hypothetical protein
MNERLKYTELLDAGVSEKIIESDSEDGSNIDIRDLDMLNLYVQEFREPKYIEVSKDKSPKKPPC